MPSKPTARDGHADAVATALSERASGRLDSRSQAGTMARTFAAELSETLDVFERDRFLAETLVIGME
jgi:hypothetical protein